MTVTIRLATLDDLPALDRVERETFSPALYHRLSKRQYRYLLTKGNCEIWVASTNGTLCGAAILFYRKNSAYGRLYSIAVTPDAQGGDVGKALLTRAEDSIKQRGLKGIIQEIRADNARLKDRYTRLGYTITGTQADYYPDGASCLKLKKDFTA